MSARRAAEPQLTVLQQNPAAGARVGRFATVVLTVSGTLHPDQRFVTVGTCDFGRPEVASITAQPCVGGPVRIKIAPLTGNF